MPLVVLLRFLEDISNGATNRDDAPSSSHREAPWPDETSLRLLVLLFSRSHCRLRRPDRRAIRDERHWKSP